MYQLQCQHTEFSKASWKLLQPTVVISTVLRKVIMCPIVCGCGCTHVISQRCVCIGQAELWTVHWLLWIHNKVCLIVPLFLVGLPGFSCSCSPQYTGGHCEMEITACVPNPCQNGGACKPIGNAFLCSCRRGFRGLTWVPVQTHKHEMKVLNDSSDPHLKKKCFCYMALAQYLFTQTVLGVYIYWFLPPPNTTKVNGILIN